MARIDLAIGTIPYRVVGPDESTAPPVVFVHGALVDGRLWDGVAERLGAAGVRSVIPDLPLGSHRTPFRDGADRSPRGVAAAVAELLERLDLDDVTLVGSDTGGALCQFLLDAHPERVGRVVLTNCDAFDTFPPFPFNVLFRLARSPRLAQAFLAPTRLTALRHSPLGYGLLAREPDPALTADWIAPALEDVRIRRDFAAFAAAIDRAELAAITPRMAAFERPVHLVWGGADRCFTPALGRRLAAAFHDATFTEIAGARTFVSLDAPDAVAEAILAA